MRRLLSAALAATLSSSIAAASDEQPDADAGARYRERRFSAGVQFAPTGGPTGVFGVVADVALFPELSVTGGVGIGGATPQLAIGLRPRLPLSAATALSVTGAYSHGDYVPLNIQMSEPQVHVAVYPNASWINGDVGLDVRLASGFFVRPFVGVSKLLYSSLPELANASICGTVCDYSRVDRRPLLGYTGFALGTSF